MASPRPVNSFPPRQPLPPSPTDAPTSTPTPTASPSLTSTPIPTASPSPTASVSPDGLTVSDCNTQSIAHAGACDHAMPGVESDFVLDTAGACGIWGYTQRTHLCRIRAWWWNPVTKRYELQSEARAYKAYWVKAGAIGCVRGGVGAASGAADQSRAGLEHGRAVCGNKCGGSRMRAEANLPVAVRGRILHERRLHDLAFDRVLDVCKSKHDDSLSCAFWYGRDAKRQRSGQWIGER